MDEIAALTDLKNSLHDLREHLARSSNNNRAVISINAGGVGVWIAATCCVVMLMVSVTAASVTAVWLSREFSRIDAQFVSINDDQQVQDAYINKLRSQQQQEKK